MQFFANTLTIHEWIHPHLAQLSAGSSLSLIGATTPTSKVFGFTDLQSDEPDLGQSSLNPSNKEVPNTPKGCATVEFLVENTFQSLATFSDFCLRVNTKSKQSKNLPPPLPFSCLPFVYQKFVYPLSTLEFALENYFRGTPWL